MQTQTCVLLYRIKDTLRGKNVHLHLYLLKKQSPSLHDPGLHGLSTGIHQASDQRVAIFIAIQRLASISRVLRHIVVLVSHCGGKFGTKYCWCCIGTSKLFEIFCVDFVGVSGSCCILRIYETRTEFVISANYLKDLGFSNVLHSLIRVSKS